MRVEEIVANLEALAGDHGIGCLPPHDRLIFVAWHASTTIARAGFGRFFAEGGDPDELERAFRRLGLPGAAAAVVTARRAFPPEHGFADVAGTRAFLDEHAAELEPAFASVAVPLLAAVGAANAGLRRATIAWLALVGVPAS